MYQYVQTFKTMYRIILIIYSILATAIPASAQDTLVNINDVVVFGHGNKKPSARVEETLGNKDIRRGLGNSFTSSLEKIKGISSIQNGATISKPVIQGMHSNRILIINNGVRQQGQQWGDDHAPEIDINNARSISVVKGAEAVRYGSDAMGGVIILNPYSLPYHRDGIHGNISGTYGSNGKRYAFTGLVDGTIGKAQDIAWRFQGTYINGGDRSTAKYLLNNTGIRELDFSGAIGINKERYGVEAYYSLYSTKLGVMYSAHMSSIDLLKERLAFGQPVEIYPYTRHIDYPYQEVNHHTAKVNAYYITPQAGKFSLQYSFQKDLRDEFHLRRNYRSNIPSLSLRLNSSQLDLAWHHVYGNWHTDIGAFYGHIKNSNVPGTGVVPIIPNYTQNNVGVYAIQQFDYKNLSLEGGIRLDHQGTNARGINAYSKAYGDKRNFTNFTYSIGGQYKLTPELSIRTNVGLAWRAPNVHELYSNGLDHASGIYAVGDSTMQSERSTKWITGVRWKNRWLEASADVFFQWVDNFIYDEPTHEVMTVISGAYPVFRYKQTDATFKGVDAEITVSPLKGWQYNVMGSMVWVKERHTGRYLPNIPSFRLNNSVRYEAPDFGRLRNNFVEVGHRFVAKQNRFDPEADLISYTPPAYQLWSMAVGTDIRLGGYQSLSVLLSAENLFNKQYKEYTNRYRYYAHDLGRDVKLTLTWNF